MSWDRRARGPIVPAGTGRRACPGTRCGCRRRTGLPHHRPDRWAASARAGRPHNGTLADYVAIEACNLAPLPAGGHRTIADGAVDFGLTAWQALFDHAHLLVGQTALIHSAACGVVRTNRRSSARGSALFSSAGKRSPSRSPETADSRRGAVRGWVELAARPAPGRGVAWR